MTTAIGVAGRNEAAEIMNHRDQAGVHSVHAHADGDVPVLVTFMKRAAGIETALASDSETKYADDDIGYSRDGSTTSFSGQSLQYPVVPGSVIVEETDGAPALKDFNKDGILYLDGYARHRASGGTFATMASESMTLKIDGGLTQTITFGTEATIAAAVAKINATLKDGTAVAQGAQNVDLRTNTSGANGSVQVVTADAGITTKLGISVGASNAVAGSVNYFTGALTLSYPGGYTPSTGDSAASVMGTVAGPWTMSPGDTLVVDTDAGGDETATFDAAQASYEGVGGSFAASNSETQGIKIDGGAAQTITYGAGTETTAAQYAAVINEQLVGGHAEVDTNSARAAVGVVNDVKAQFNTHIADLLSHTNDDSTNATAVTDATDLATAMTLANDLKAKINLHLAAVSELEECIALANELKADYNAHCVIASQLSESITLLNEIKADYNAHISETSTLEESIALANDIKAQYEAHRIDTGVHSIANTTDSVAAADATNLATAITLANELKVDYNNHRTDTNEDSHPTDDDSNTVTAANASDQATLKTLLNELQTQYTAHIASASFHTSADTTNVITADAVDTNAIHLEDNTSDATAAANATDLASAYTLANELKADYNNHRTDINEDSHGTDDDTNTIASADANTIASLVTLVGELKTDINAHMASSTFHVNADTTNTITTSNVGTAAVHQIPCTVTTSSADATDLASAITLANELKADYNDHRTDTTDDCHGTDDDTNVVAAANASDLDTLITLLTEIKLDYNAHCANTGAAFHINADATNVTTEDDPQTAAVHEQDDATNTIGSADATDLASLLTLATELKSDYDAHRTQANVHDADDAANATTATLSTLKVLSDVYGTDGSVEISTSGSTIAAKTGLVQGGTASGTGDVGDITAVTPTEAKTVIEADTTDLTVTVVEDKLQLTADTSVNVNATSTLETVFGLSTTIATATSGGSAPLSIAYMQTAALDAGERATRRIVLPENAEMKVYGTGQNGASKVRVSIEPVKF